MSVGQDLYKLAPGDGRSLIPHVVAGLMAYTALTAASSAGSSAIRRLFFLIKAGTYIAGKYGIRQPESQRVATGDHQ